MPSSARSRIDAFLRQEGYQNTLFHYHLAKDPLAYIDVGARGGEHAVVEPMAGATRVLAFEPDDVECARLEVELKRGSPWAEIEIMAVALAGRKGPATLHLFKSPLNASLLSGNPDFASRYNVKSLAPQGTVPLETVTLDDALYGGSHFPGGHGDFVKIDAQGADLDILRGAPRMLAERTVALLVEVEFCSIYREQPYFSQVEQFLRNEGFFFYGFHDTHLISGRRLDKRVAAGRERLIWADAVFFRDPLESEGRPLLGERRRTALIVSAVMLGYHDFALELVDKLFPEHSLQEPTLKFIRQWASISKDQILASLQSLQTRLGQEPEGASPLVALGKFIDTWRSLPDYNEFPNP